MSGARIAALAAALPALALAAPPGVVAADGGQRQRTRTVRQQVLERFDCMAASPPAPEPLAAVGRLRVPRTWSVDRFTPSQPDPCDGPQLVLDPPRDPLECRGSGAFIEGDDNKQSRMSLHEFLRSAGGRELASGALPRASGMRGAWIELADHALGGRYFDAAYVARDHGEFYELTIFPSDETCGRRDRAAAARSAGRIVKTFRVRFSGDGPRQGTPPSA
jgi:hypothetical protein